MLNKKIIGLFVLGLALSSPLQSANAMPSPGATSCYEPAKCKRGYNSKGNAMGEKNIGSGDCWCVYDINNSFFTMHMEDDEWVSGHSEDTNGCVIPGECIANSKSLCETQNKYSTCKAVNELTGSNTECWRPNGCKTAYTQIAGQCGSDVNNYDMDDFGCGKCNCEIMTTTSDYVKYVSSGTSCPSGFSFQDPVAGVACMGCCKYGGQISCENDNPGFNCKTIDNNLGCYEPSTCKDGYTLTEGACVQDIITYGSITECEAANPGFVCDYYGGSYGDASKWASTGTCKSGYTMSTDGKCVSSNPCAELGFGDNLYPYDLCVSSCSGSCSTGTPVRYYSTGSGLASCYSCCAYKDQAACEEANSGFACELDANGACYAPTTSCKDGYKLDNGACIPQTCEEGTYPSKEECEEKYPGFECGEVGDDSSLGSGAQGHSEGGN